MLFCIHKNAIAVIFCKKRSERIDCMKKIIFIGGDRRMVYAAEALGKKYACRLCGLGSGGYDIKNGGELFDYAVLPLQKSADGVTIPCPLSDGNSSVEYSILGAALKEGGIVFTGSVFPLSESICRSRGLTLINYAEREELAVANAVPTAEGALEIAISRLPITIFGSAVLITGYGRIAKILAKYLHAMGARISVACRKRGDLKWAEICGFTAVDITDKGAFGNAASRADVIFNTVPSELFGGEEISVIKQGAIYIELASADGIDVKEAEKHRIEIITARGLPGKTAPVTAGRIIAEAIENILAERGDEVEA